MRSKKLNYIIEISTLIFFSLAFVLLIKPWLLFLTDNNISYGQYIWVFSLIIVTVYLYEKISKLTNKFKKVFFILLYIVINMYIIYLLNWTFLIFYPLFFILLTMSLRYWSYKNNKLKLFTDVFLGFFFMSINLYIKNILAFDIDILTVIIFFISSFSLIIIFNSHYNNRMDFSSTYNVLIPVVIIFLFIIIFISLMLGFGLEGGLLDLLSNLIGDAYDFVTTLFLYILYPLFWLAIKLISFIMSFFPEGERLSGQESGGETQNIPERISVEGNIPNVLIYVIQIILVIGIVYFIVRKIKQDKSDSDKPYEEERQSIFSKNQITDDLKELWSSIKNIFTNKKSKKTYDNGALGNIRENYYEFLLYYNKNVQYEGFQTPLEYFNKIINKVRNQINEANKENINKLTEIYNRARYGKKGKQKDAEESKNLLRKIKENSDDNNKQFK